MSLKLKAKAIVAVRRRKKLEAEAAIALAARESALIERLLAKVELPIAKDGINGRDAPTLSDIVAEILPQLPEPNTVVQMVEHPTVSKDDLHEDMEVFIKGYLPTILPEDRPAVEQIIQETTIDVSDEKLEGFVSQSEFKKTLEKIQDAITASQGGRGPSYLAEIQDNAQEIEELSEALNTLITNLTAQGLTTQDILRSIESIGSHTEDELRLLNLRTEEAYDTKLDKKDIT